MLRTIFEINYEAKITTKDNEIHEDEYSLRTTLDLGIEDEKDWFEVDEGIIYGEAFKKAMNMFFDEELSDRSIPEIKEATITIKKVELISQKSY